MTLKRNLRLDPTRVVADPNAVLDVVVNNPSTYKGIPSLQFQQLALRSPSQDDDSTTKVEIASESATPASSAMSSPSTTSASTTTPSIATSTARRNPVYGLVETAMENYNHIDRPLAFPLARGPQAVQDDQTCPVKDLSATPHSPSDNETQQRSPLEAATNIPKGKDVVQTSIGAYCGDKEAQVVIGDMYKDGRGVPQDYQTAMEWYLKSANQGHAFA